PLAANSRPRTDICGLDSRPQTTNRRFHRRSFALPQTPPHFSFRSALPRLLRSRRAVPASQNLPGLLSSVLSLPASTRAMLSADWRGNAHRLSSPPALSLPIAGRLLRFPAPHFSQKHGGAGGLISRLLLARFRRRRSVSLPKRSGRA